MTHEEAKTLKIGDVVQMNSGGPQMTVAKKEHNFITCFYWFEAENIFKNTTQDYAMLTLINQG